MGTIDVSVPGGAGAGGAPDAQDEHARRSRRRMLAAAAGVLAAVAAVAVVLLSSSSASPRATSTGIPAGDTTSVVARRTLSESSTVDGTLGYGSTLELYDRLGGTFTWLPSVGAIVSRGQALFRIDNEPVVLMYGSVPAYRELKQGVSDGPDVTELNENLIALGYDPYGAIGERDYFGEATAAAVKRWQEADGLSETGEVQLGRVVFAPGARRITAVKVTLGQDPPEAASAPTTGSTTPATTTPATTTPATTTSASTTSASTTPAATTGASTTPSSAPSAQPGAGEHKGSRHPSRSHPGSPSRRAASSPSRASSPAKGHPSSKSGQPSSKSGQPSSKSGQGAADEQPGKHGEGGAGGAGELVLSTTSTQQIVQLKVKAEQQQLARVGNVAPVLLPGGSSVPGRITSVGTVASSASSGEDEKGGGGGSSPSPESGESATIAVTLVLEHRVARLDEAPVSVELLKTIRHGVLTVPATALIATAGGGYAVQTLAGNRVVPLAVTPGMFSQGFVQIEGAGVRSGLTVLVPE